jgi:hypothetical protein
MIPSERFFLNPYTSFVLLLLIPYWLPFCFKLCNWSKMTLDHYFCCSRKTGNIWRTDDQSWSTLFSLKMDSSESTTQIARLRWANVGFWLYGWRWRRNVGPTLGQRMKIWFEVSWIDCWIHNIGPSSGPSYDKMTMFCELVVEPMMLGQHSANIWKIIKVLPWIRDRTYIVGPTLGQLVFLIPFKKSSKSCLVAYK